MRTSTLILYTLVGLAGLCHLGFTSPIVKRQVLDNPKALDPANQNLDDTDDADRGKRLVEGGVQLKYGAKSAVLGLLFNKINQYIDSKTAWVNQLDQLNVAKNKAYGIESPKDPISSFGDLFGSVLSTKLTAAGPIISLVTQKLTSASGGASGGHAGGGGAGALLGSLGSLFAGSSGGQASVSASATAQKPVGYGVQAGVSYGLSG